jgi:hypothetical protein
MVGMANYAPPDANGHSIAFDPIAFTEKGSRDSLVVEAGEQEGSTWRALIWRRSASTGRASRGAMPSGNRTATACWSSSVSRSRLCA